MHNSEHFGMTFWLDNNNDFCYCPTFTNNTPDLHNWGYVTEWTEFDSSDLDKLFEIHRQLVITKAIHVNNYLRKEEALL